jgi:hypothetical protein
MPELTDCKPLFVPQYKRFKVLSGDNHLGWIHRETAAEALAVAKGVFREGDIRVEAADFSRGSK